MTNTETEVLKESGDTVNGNKAETENQEEKIKPLEEMYKAGVHFGYTRSRKDPRMGPYIFGLKNNNEIFDLEAVQACLERAREFLKNIAKLGGKALFVGTKAEARDTIEEIAKELNMPYVNLRWLGGTLTNFKTMKAQMAKLEDYLAKKKSGALSKLIKKEAIRMEKEFSRMNRKFSGILSLKDLPSAIVVLDSKQEETAVLEAKKMNIPVVAVLNSDSDPTLIDYPIPANDASDSSIKYVLGKLAEAYKAGVNSNE